VKLSKEEFMLKLSKELENSGVELSHEKLEKLYLYKELLIEWNQKINLTAITDDEEIIIKHIIDSIYVLPHINDNSKVVDVGTGAGLPGVILAICKDNIHVTLLDALQKRIIFLNDVIEKLGLTNTVAIHARAEEAGQNVEYREKYDVVVSRAVASLNVLIELTSPFAKLNGTCIYMKADKTEQEITEEKKAIQELSLKHIDTIGYTLKLNEEEITHTLIKYKKQNTTKSKYPRQFAKIKKSPL